VNITKNRCFTDCWSRSPISGSPDINISTERRTSKGSLLFWIIQSIQHLLSRVLIVVISTNISRCVYHIVIIKPSGNPSSKPPVNSQLKASYIFIVLVTSGCVVNGTIITCVLHRACLVTHILVITG